MPTFRTTPSSNLTGSIRRLLASGGGKLGPLGEMQADQAAATTARNMSLAEKARAEVEAMRGAQADRADPALATEYASHAAGIDVPTGTRLSDHIRGKLEQPSIADKDDADMIGAEAQPYVTGAPNVDQTSTRLFRSALASTIANRIATGKTNAQQLAQAGDRVNETALTNVAANTEDTPTANRIVAAVAGKIRQPFRTGPQGQVLDTEQGTVNEDTALAQAAATLSGSRASLADSRKAAVDRAADKGGNRVTPQQVERWVSDAARKEWDTIPAKERKGMSYAQHLDKVRERFKATSTKDPQAEVTEAHDAIAGGADKTKVAKRFKQRMGFDMPEPPVLADEVDDETE